MNTHISRILPIITDVVAGRKTARHYTEQALAAIKTAEDFHVVLCSLDERALQRADNIDKAIAAGEVPGRLAGVPFIVKDNLLAFGGPTTAGSLMLADFQAPYQATVIERLEAEGAIVVGKANLDAFAHGSSTENSAFGPTKNPHDPERVPGGSSGGSAAAVALNIVPFALGSDTGGSIRQPASFCGVLGFKPTYGAVSRHGAVAMASSTDVIGVLSQTAADAQLVFEIMGGSDQLDSTSHSEALRPAQSFNVAEARVGVIKQYLQEGVDTEVKALVQAAVDRLQKAGATIVEIDLPSLDLALPAYYIIVPAEISSNLSRYDGIKFGHHSQIEGTLDEFYAATRAEGFGDENIRRIIIGTYVLSSGYYDAYYRKAQIVRTLLINEFQAAFGKADFLVGPVAPTPAFKRNKNTTDPLQMYLEDVMTVGVSLAGLPAVSVPVGKTGKLPVGIQVIGAQNHDMQVLQMADAILGEVPA